MGKCKLECPDGETQCCICCDKQGGCDNRCDMMDSYEYAEDCEDYIDKGLDIDIELDKDKEKDNNLIVSKDTIRQTDVRRVIEEWNKLQNVGIAPIRDIKPASKRCQLLNTRICPCYGKLRMMLNEIE